MTTKYHEENLAVAFAYWRDSRGTTDYRRWHALTIAVRDAAQDLLRALKEDELTRMKAQMDADKATLAALQADAGEKTK